MSHGFAEGVEKGPEMLGIAAQQETRHGDIDATSVVP